MQWTLYSNVNKLPELLAKNIYAHNLGQKPKENEPISIVWVWPIDLWEAKTFDSYTTQKSRSSHDFSPIVQAKKNSKLLINRFATISHYTRNSINIFVRLKAFICHLTSNSLNMPDRFEWNCISSEIHWMRWDEQLK